MMRTWLTRWRMFFLRREPDAVDEELRFHLERAVEMRVAAGMTPEEARRLALIEFGGLERAREQ
jgi:putative ABC transport system permease protein